MSGINIDWKAIHPLNGSRPLGFEELCAQLARAETPPDARFERNGAPDAGVECYSVLTDGGEWGWQAKYFDQLGDSQWAQLDGSVKTALEKHPRLVRYIVCLPIDRADARKSGRRSAKDRWNDHAKKWAEWATARGMTVEFCYWGSHELLERLVRREHIGRVLFWFDVHGFDEDWFAARLSEALTTADPRYTPEIHVDLPIAAKLEAFGRTPQFFDQIKAHARGIRRYFQRLIYSDSKLAESPVNTATVTLASKVDGLLTEFGAIVVRPIGELPFRRIAERLAEATHAAEELEGLLAKYQTESDLKPRFPEYNYALHELMAELRTARKALASAATIAGGHLLLLKGPAGAGKTHLLCDVARHRTAAGRPTVLLMGQRFIGTDAPWIQALQQLDLPGLSAEEFVGALEAAAQVAGCRALVILDALNEGAGRVIWPSHLTAFLSHLERSPWIGVVLSVRSSYEELVIPEQIRVRAVTVEHHGFADHEYDATRAFFTYYGIELPSTPLLAPEFANPLFLKTLCRGLHIKGERRLPRGFQGISAVFDLFVDGINGRLSSLLGFNPKEPLVRRALETLAQVLVGSGDRWLTRVSAEQIVNDLLPGREFERSLYRGLVAEGLLVEEGPRRQHAARDEVVFFAYDRFTDHLIAKTLLDAHLDSGDPANAFKAGQPLAFLADPDGPVSPGLLEALFIQVSERTGKELADLAPTVLRHWGAANAFRQSLVWRAPGACFPETRRLLNKIIRNEYELADTLDVLLTVAPIAEHPLNANFLDARLRSDPMPDRDVWWSTYLHRAWQTHGAVDRLVDWAFAVTPSVALDATALDLCATALSWFFTTSHRFLRDRATQALVNLLTGRLGAVERLVDRFASTDDPYVTERVFAVAYGTVMRSHDAEAVGRVAERAYFHIFATGTPPGHVLLRDYARGVIERAVSLGARIDIDIRRIRPPYTSQWPVIPSPDAVGALMSPWSKNRAETEWALHRIRSSVMDDDFARYVIGTNFWSTNWLNLRREDPVWRSPRMRLADLVTKFSPDQRTAWEIYRAADQRFKLEQSAAHFEKLSDDDQLDDMTSEATEFRGAHPDAIGADRESARAVLLSILSAQQAHDISLALNADESDERLPPRFDLRVIQRYVLWRVFDLGWTTERFGAFDYRVPQNGRDAYKAERIGKKYQWIAYHEIAALVADHFQYMDDSRGEGGGTYIGPWQERLRDIDPSCGLRSALGGTSWDGHTVAWWAAVRHEDWGDASGPKDWVARCDNLPRVEDLLCSLRPEDTSRWLNAQGTFRWRQAPPADMESTDVERREIIYICTGYLLRAQDKDAFLAWAEVVDFWTMRMPEAPEVHRMFLGEHGWSPASRYFEQSYFREAGWTTPGNDCPVSLQVMAFDYLREASGYDCSLDTSYTLSLPASELVRGLGLRWSGYCADYLDTTGELAAFDPTTRADGPDALLFRDDLLRKFLAREDLAVCWVMRGEKRVIDAGFDPKHRASLQITGAYVLGEDGPRGFMRCMLYDERETSKTSLIPIATLRSGG